MKPITLATLLFLFSAPAMAYVGPGLGMGVIGTIFGVLAAIVLALFGLFWYPLKRALGKKKAAGNDPQTTAEAPTVAEDQQAGHPGTIPTRPENPAETRPDNHVTGHPGAISDTPEPGSATRREPASGQSPQTSPAAAPEPAAGQATAGHSTDSQVR